MFIGYVNAIFEFDKHVEAMLQAGTKDYSKEDGRVQRYRVPSQIMGCRDVNLIVAISCIRIPINLSKLNMVLLQVCLSSPQQNAMFRFFQIPWVVEHYLFVGRPS